MANDMRLYETFYGINTDKWSESFGAFSNTHKILVKNYISDGCICTVSSAASDTNEFLYPHHIKKTYFIEGVIKGHITLGCSNSSSTVTSYRVTVGKTNEDEDKEDLFTTGWVAINTTLVWDSTYSIGEEEVFPFSIDAWEYEELGEFDRLFIRIEVNGDNYARVYHSNDQTWEDIKIEIPFRL